MPSAYGFTPPPAEAAYPVLLPDAFAREAIIAWYRGEFAAANAIIDALCGHLKQIGGGGGGDEERGSDYDAVFAAIHQRRLNWIPLLHRQRYFSISSVAAELRRAADRKAKRREGRKEDEGGMEEADAEAAVSPVADSSPKDSTGDSSLDQKIPNGALITEPEEEGDIQICSNHEDCEQRPELIKLTKGFVAKEPVKGHMANVVKGLKLYDDIFTKLELSKLIDLANSLRISGRKGELSGETFIFFNKQLKGNKREMIQMGVPIFGPIREDMETNIEPIPPIIEAVIDHLVQWRLIPESRRPNSCLISFFDEGDYSQPYLKPPHLDQPISTLLLFESIIAFGRTLVADQDGNYKGSLTLSTGEGSLLVMRGNSAEMAKHVMCPSPNKRISITLSKVRPAGGQPTTSPAPLQPAGAMLLQPRRLTGGVGLISYERTNVAAPTWEAATRTSPLFMVAPPRPLVVAPRKMARGGTGVFLPWAVSSKRTAKHLPPRIRSRLSGPQPSAEAQAENLPADGDDSL